MRPSDKIRRILGAKVMQHGSYERSGMSVAESIARRNEGILDALIQMLDQEYDEKTDDGYAKM